MANTHIRFDLSPSSSSIMSGEPEPMIHHNLKCKMSDKNKKIKKKLKKISNKLTVEEKLHILTKEIGRLIDTIQEVRHKLNKLFIHFDTISYKID